MSVTQSNHDYEDEEDDVPRTRPIYYGQFKTADIETLTEARIEFVIDNLNERSKELTQMRADFGRLLSRWGFATGTPFFTNEEETIYAGPPAEGAKTSQLVAGRGWIIMFPSRRVSLNSIREAIDEMRTYGRRKKSTAEQRKRYREAKQPKPIINKLPSKSDI